MTAVKISAPDIQRLVDSLGTAASNLTKELNVVAWKTAKKGQSIIAKQVGSELNTTQREIKKLITVKRHEGAASSVILWKSKRPDLKEFNPRHNKQGVYVKISRTKGGKTIPGAFQGPRPGVMKTSWRGNAFKRVGKSRLPIRKLRGASPWGVFVKNDQIRPTIESTLVELRKQLNERIRYNTLKIKGGLNWQQPSYVSDQATGEN